MVVCSSDDECSGHGYCTREQCNCDLGWFHDNCNASGVSEWGVFWILFRGIFAAGFLLLALYAFKKLWGGVLLRRSLGCRLIAWRLLRSPKNLSLCLILMASLLRGLWVCLDPLSFEGLTSHLGDRLLYDTVFPAMYCVYSCVLLVWSGLYHAVTSGRKDWSKGVRYTILVLMGISFAVSLSFSICQGLRTGSKQLIVPGVIFVVLAASTILGGICFFGLLLNKYIVRSGSGQENEWEEVPRSLLISSNLDNTEDHLPVLTPTLSRQTMESDLVLMRAQTVSMKAVMETEYCEESQEKSRTWSVSNTSFRLDEAASPWSRFNSSLHLSSPQPSPPPAPLKSAQSDEKNYIVLMSWQDKLILRQIIILTTVSTLTGVIVIALTLIIAASEVVHESKWALILLYLVSAMEFFAYVVVLLIFSTEIKVKSKENLQFISEVTVPQIALRISKSPGKVTLQPRFTATALAKRLNNFVSP